MNAKSSSDLIQDDHDLNDFQQRAVNNDNQIRRSSTVTTLLRGKVAPAVQALPQKIRKTPKRYMLHLLVVLLLPIGLIFNAAHSSSTTASVTVDATSAQNQVRPVLGLSTMSHRNDPAQLTAQETVTPGDAPISDPEFDDSLVIPVSRPVEDTVSSATVSAEIANLRKGPSTEFDRLDKLAQATKVTLIARHADWAQVKTEGGQEGWLALDVLDLSDEVATTLPEAQTIPTLPPAKVATIAQEGLNLRDGPGKDYVSLTKLGADSRVSLLARYDGWYQIETDSGAIGWVAADFLNMKDGVAERISIAEKIPSANPALVGWTTDEGINLRSGPSTKYDSLGKLAQGAELTLLAQYNDWLKVQTAKGTKGWISSDLVDVSSFVMRRVPYTDNIPALPKPKVVAKPAATKKVAPAVPAAPAGAASGDVASMAWAYVGAAYVWGAEGPYAFDCSGLTKFLYRQIGVSLPHSARGQYSSAYGSFVSMDELQPGDLLFYANTAGPGITHVGIYVGGGTMVNAMTPASGVGAVSIYSSYWLNHYYGALRPYR